LTERDALKIGIFLCECGGNISDGVDVKALAEAIKSWRGVAVVRRETYLCSKPAQDTIISEVKKHGLNRVIVAACTPRMHLATFQNAVQLAGLNLYLLEFVNIREQCSWVHGAQKSREATEKALSLIRGGYERVFELEPLEQISEKCSRDVLVIGGGISGIVASIELGNMGHKVYLAERDPSIGGHMAKLTKVFPTLDCAQCILTPRMAEAGRHRNVQLLTYSEVRSVSGRPGNYRATIFTKPRGVDLEKCRGCGGCVKVCPVTCPDEFNEFRSVRKAAYIQLAQAVPYSYVIDFKACTRCGKCVEVCPSKAINLGDRGRTVELEVGSIIIATGYENFDAGQIKEYGYGSFQDIVTMMELERLTSLFGPTGGVVKRYSDGGEVRSIAIILCAGSRDKNRFIPYCSRICCMYSIKQAVLLKEQFGIDVWVYYTDIRAGGRGYEELYWRAEKAGVFFVRGKVGEIWRRRSDGKLMVKAEDTLTNSFVEKEFDMVALAVPMVPPTGLAELAAKMSLPLGEDGFIQEKHPKLDPVNSLSLGLFACGCALGPKDVRDTVSDSLGAAAKVGSFLSTGYVTTSPEKAFVKPDLCDGCKVCVEVCPVKAIVLQDAKARIDPLVCVGCGGCIPICPKNAIDFKNLTSKQLAATLRGLLENKKTDEIRVMAFIEKTIAYTGVDFLGLERAHYPPNVLVVPMPSAAFVGLQHLLQAFALGADGVIIIEGQHNIDEKFMKERIGAFKSSLKAFGIEGLRILYRLVELPAYKKTMEIFREHASMVHDLGPLPDSVRNNIEKKIFLLEK